VKDMGFFNFFFFRKREVERSKTGELNMGEKVTCCVTCSYSELRSC